LIFLFQFDKSDDGIDFVLNERIAEDMDTQSEELLGPLVFSTCQVLMHYKEISKSDTIMSGMIVETDEFEVTLSEGLGQYIDPFTKNSILFENAKIIADLLVEIMSRTNPSLTK
jgi:hypothetical protein